MTSEYDHKLNELKRFIPFLEKTIRILVKTCPDLTTSRKANLNKLKYLRDLLVNQNKRTTIECLLEYEKLLTKLYEKIQPKVNISSICKNDPTERQKSDFEEAKPDVSADKSRATEAEVVCTFSSKESALFQLRASKGSMSPTLYSAEKSLMNSFNNENRDLNMPQGSPDMDYSKNNTNIKSCDSEDLLRKESQITEDLTNAETEENLEGIRKEKIKYAELTDNENEEKEMFTVKQKSDLNTLSELGENQQNTPKTGSHNKKPENSSKMCDFIAGETTIQPEDNISGICKTVAMERKQKSDLEATTSIEVNLITREKAKPDISVDKSRSTEGKVNCSFSCGEAALFQRRSNNSSLSPEKPCFTEKSLKKSSNEVNLNLNIPQGSPNTDYAKNKNNTNIKSKRTCNNTEDLLREESQITTNNNLTTAEREIEYEELTESEGEEKETFTVKQKSDSNALSELEENQLNVPKTESDASNNKNEDSISDYCRTIPLNKQQKLDFEASRIKLKLITREATNVIAAHKSGATMAEVICSSSSEEPALFQRRSNKSTMSPKLCSTEKSVMKSFKHSPENTIGLVTQDLVSPENHSSNRIYKEPLFVRRSPPRSPRKQSPFNDEKNKKKSFQDENQEDSSTKTGVSEQDYVREREVEIECIELTDSGSEDKEFFEVNNKADLNALSEFGEIQPDKILYAPSNKKEENYAKTCDVINVTEKSYRETGEDIETYNMQTDNVSICMTSEKQNNVNDTCNDIASKEPSKANKILKERVVSEIDILQALKNDILNETLPIPAVETKTPALHQPITTKVLSSKKKISVAIYKEKILKTNFVPLFPNVSPKNTADKINLTQQTPTLPFMRDDATTSPSLFNIGEGTTTPIHIYKSFDGPVTTNNNLISDKSNIQSNWSNQYNYAQMTGSQFHEQNNAPSTQSHPFSPQDLQITSNYRNNLPVELGYPFEHNVATMPSMITARQNNEKMAPTNYYCQNNTQMALNPTFEQNNALMTPISSSFFGKNYPPMTPIPIFGRNNLSMTSTITQTQRGHNFEENQLQRDRDERKLNKNNIRNQNRAWVFGRQRRPYFRNVNMLTHNRSRTNYATNSLYTRNQRQKERSHNVRMDREGKGFDDFNQQRARSMKRQMKEYYSNKEKELSMQRNTPSKCNKKLPTGRLETKNEKTQQLGNSIKKFVIPKIGDQVKKVKKTAKPRSCGISSDSENDTATVRKDTRFPSQISVETKSITVASPGVCLESGYEKTNKRKTCKKAKMNLKPNEGKNISKNVFRQSVPRKEPDINQEDLNDSLKTLSDISSGTEKDTEKTEMAAKFHREMTSETKKSTAISARGTKRTKKGIISSDSFNIDKKIYKVPRKEPDIKQYHSKNRSDNLKLPSDDVVTENTNTKIQHHLEHHNFHTKIDFVESTEVNPLKNTKSIKSKIADDDNLSTDNYDTAVNDNAAHQSGLQLNKPEHTSDKPQTNKLKTKQTMSICLAISELKVKIITNRSCESKQNINENKVNNIQIVNQQSFTDKEYCFLKDVSRYPCRLCQYIGNDIVKHYKTKHPHCEVPLSRMHPDIAQEAIDQRVNFQVISEMPSENYTCRFCFEVFNETNNNLERFFSHIVSSHTGEYRQDICSECVDVTNCPMNRDIISPPKNTKGQLFGYICRECYFTQISLANLKRHVTSRHDEQTEICIINMAVMSNETIEAFKHQHDLRSKKSVEAQHCPLKIQRSNVSLTEINDIDNSNQETTSIQKLPQSSAQQSIDTRLSFENEDSSVNAKLSNDSSEVKIELQVKKVLDNGELSTSEYKNISPPENKSKSKEINKQNTSDDSVVVYPHFKINFNEAGNKEYVCCINGTDNHYKTTLLVSMKTHIQTKHSENWDGYCFICRAIVTPQGKHFFKECFQHCLDQHIDSFPILENIISGDCNAPTETLKPTKHRVDVNELLSEHKMINNEFDMLPKFEREVSLGSPVHTKIEPPQLSPTFENRRTQPSEDPFVPSKYEEVQAEIMSQKHRVVLESMMAPDKLVRIFKCAGGFCSFTTDSAGEALSHASTHSRVGGENAMKCSYCDFDPSGNAIDLVTHVFKAHGSCPYACGLCFYRASSSQLVGAHIERFHQQPVAAGSVLKTILLASPAADNTGLLPRETAVAEYVCKNDYPDCKFRTYIAETFTDHLSKHNTDRLFSCFICDVKAASPVELVTHLKSHGLKRYQCTWCVHGADNETELLFHASEKHPSKQPQAYLRVKEEIKDNAVPALVYLNETKVAFQEVAAACESENPEREVDWSINLQNLIESISKAKGPTNSSTMTTTIPNKSMAPIKNEQVESVPSQSIEQICLDGSDEDSVGPNLSQKMTNSQLSECQVNQERSIPSRKGCPRYVPDSQRRACGAPACCFISVDNETFKQHWDTHHSATTHFKCLHCLPTQKLNTSQQLNAGSILAHLKMHEETLYACSDCTYYHFRRRAVEKHNADAHAGAGRVLVVREEAPPDPAPAPANPPPAPTMDLKPWQCGLCQFKSMLRQQVVEHCTKEHQFKMQYKCAYCPYRASTFENVPKHQTNSHPNSPEDVIHFYYREDSVPDAADGTPRWVRQRQKMNLADVKTEASEPAAPELLSVLTPSVFHCNSHREPASLVEVSREPQPGSTGTIQDSACQSQEPLVPSDVENCLPFGRYEESGPNPKVPLTVRNRSASEDSNEEDRLLIDESSQDQPSLIRCKYCEFKTFYRQNMLSHTLLHYNLKPYKCGYCDYNGHRKSTLLHTKQVHPQLQPLVVSIKEPSGPPLILKLNKTGKRFAVQKRH